MSISKHALGAAIFVMAAAGLAGTADAKMMSSSKTVMVGGAAMYPSKNIIENAVNSKDHTTLVAAVKAAGLVDTLSGPGPFTVFAPTNAAFAKLPAGTVETLVKPENKATLTTILTYHVVSGTMDSKAIAKAIRQATVLAQYHAARKQGNYVFDVRYGLGQELLRASAYPDNFIAALGAFLQSFNAENARIDERITKGALANLPQNRRASVRTTHIDAIVALVDKHGSDVVCKLLVAYGYARDPQTPRDEAPHEEHLAEITENDGE